MSYIGTRRALLGGVALRPVFFENFLTESGLPSANFNANFSYSGPALKTQVDASGLITYGPNNLLTFSNTFNNAAWTNTGETLTSGQTDPNGGSNAWLVVPTAASLFHSIVHAATPFNSNNTQSIIYFKSSGYSNLKFNVPTVVNGSGVVQPGTGTVLQKNTTAITFTFTQLPNGWTEVCLTLTGGPYTGMAGAEWGPTNQTTDVAFTGDGVSGGYLYSAVIAAVTHETSPRPQDQVITTSAAYYGLRINDYSPSSVGTPLGALIEQGATNLILQSGNQANAAWTATSSVVSPPTLTANSAIAPDGTMSATKGVYPAVSVATTYSVVFQTYTAAAASYATSIHLKGNAGGETLYLAANTGGVTFLRQVITLTTSWQRYILVGTETGASWDIQIGTDLRDGSQSATPAQTIFMWGAQVELGSFATSYIPTGASAVARSADQITIIGSAFAALKLPSLTVVSEFNPYVVSTLTAASPVSAYINASSPDFGFIDQSTTHMGTFSGSGSSLFTTNSPSTGVKNRVVVAGNGQGRSIVLNGGTVASDSQAVLTSLPVTSATLGWYTITPLYANAHISAFVIYGIRLPPSAAKQKSIVGAPY